MKVNSIVADDKSIIIIDILHLSVRVYIVACFFINSHVVSNLIHK